MLDHAKMYEMVQGIPNFPHLTLGGVSQPDTDYAKHYGDVIMGVIESQITSLTIVYSSIYVKTAICMCILSRSCYITKINDYSGRRGIRPGSNAKTYNYSLLPFLLQHTGNCLNTDEK